MEWVLHLLDEGSDKYVVELYLAFSDDAIDVITYWALNAEPLETEKMFDEDALERVRQAQQYEIQEAGDDREKTRRFENRSSKPGKVYRKFAVGPHD